VWRTFVHNVEKMCVPGGGGTLEEVLPLATGKHKMVLWECRYLVAVVPSTLG
jgi:hypothetical protein